MADWHTRAIIYQIDSALFYDLNGDGCGDIAGIAAKLAAYHLQDGGTDTVDANLELGLPADARDYSVAAQALRELGAESVRLITNNPKKVSALELGGIVVSERVPSPVNQTPENTRYLQTKRDRMGHTLPGDLGVT